MVFNVLLLLWAVAKSEITFCYDDGKHEAWERCQQYYYYGTEESVQIQCEAIHKFCEIDNYWPDEHAGDCFWTSTRGDAVFLVLLPACSVLLVAFYYGVLRKSMKAKNEARTDVTVDKNDPEFAKRRSNQDKDDPEFVKRRYQFVAKEPDLFPGCNSFWYSFWAQWLSTDALLSPFFIDKAHWCSRYDKTVFLYFTVAYGFMVLLLLWFDDSLSFWSEFFGITFPLLVFQILFESCAYSKQLKELYEKGYTEFDGIAQYGCPLCYDSWGRIKNFLVLVLGSFCVGMTCEGVTHMPNPLCFLLNFFMFSIVFPFCSTLVFHVVMFTLKWHAKFGDGKGLTPLVCFTRPTCCMILYFAGQLSKSLQDGPVEQQL